MKKRMFIIGALSLTAGFAGTVSDNVFEAGLIGLIFGIGAGFAVKHLDKR